MIRVTRLMEYTFKDMEEAEANMARWAVPPNGTHNFGQGTKKHLVVRSAIIIDTGFERDEPE